MSRVPRGVFTLFALPDQPYVYASSPPHPRENKIFLNFILFQVISLQYYTRFFATAQVYRNSACRDKRLQCSPTLPPW